MADLSAMTPQTRFSDRASDYAKYRPTYPAAVVDWLLAGLPAAAKLRIADIGAGTGISSRLLADRGAQVVAVDPNEEMLEKAKRHTRVRYVAAAAEATGLPAHSFDLIACFQAFHWFARDATMREFGRILKPRGRIAAVWNDRDLDDAFTRTYTEFVRTFGENVETIQGAKTHTPVAQALRDAGFVRVEEREFRHYHRMDRESFIGYARSTSYLPREGAEYERLRAGMDEIYGRYADGEGYVVFPYRTVAHRGDAAAGAPAG